MQVRESVVRDQVAADGCNAVGRTRCSCWQAQTNSRPFQFCIISSEKMMAFTTQTATAARGDGQQSRASTT
jgi:hypothetical protein